VRYAIMPASKAGDYLRPRRGRRRILDIATTQLSDGRKMQIGEVSTSACVPCNQCIAEMDRGGVRCTRP